MSKRIKSARDNLFQKMCELETPGNWEHIINHCGMFTFTGLTRTFLCIIKFFASIPLQVVTYNF